VCVCVCACVRVCVGGWGGGGVVGGGGGQGEEKEGMMQSVHAADIQEHTSILGRKTWCDTGGSCPWGC